MRTPLRALLAAVLVAAVAVVAPGTEARAEVDVYTTPGTHHVNGRLWRTSCEPYSQTSRCRTEIKATMIVARGGSFQRVDGWAFNNLTYLPSPRSLWKGNPLAMDKWWVDAKGRQWRTECDTPNTGRGACRTYVMTDVPVLAGDQYLTVKQWVFNNLVRFSTAPTPSPAPSPTPKPTPKPSPSPSQLPDEVRFPDAAMTQCVRVATGGGQITRAAVESLTTLRCSQYLSSGMKLDLRGIGQLTSLTIFAAEGLALTSVEPLRGMTTLRELYLMDTQVSDLRPLAALSGLESVHVGGTKVTDLTPLYGLSRLRGLGVRGLPVGNLEWVSAFTGLKSLDVGDTTLPDLTPLAGLALTYLVVDGTGISDLTPLTGMPLTALNIAENPVVDLRPLAGMSLNRLWLAGTKVTDLTAVRDAPLVRLSLARTAVTDLRSLSKMPLDTLVINGTRVSDVSPLATVSTLKHLFAENTAVRDWKPLAGLVAKGLVIHK